MALISCSDLLPAAWITSSAVPWHQRVTFGPQEFRGYARLRLLPDPDPSGQEKPSFEADAPDEYDLLRITMHVLSEHTRTPEDLYFCMWDGWGTSPTLQDIPMVTLPHRSYFLFRGALADFDDWDSPRMTGISAGNMPSPAFTWPC